MTNPVDIAELTKAIAAAQREIAQILDDAAESVRWRTEHIDGLARQLIRELAAPGSANITLARRMAKALQQHRVNVGELTSDLSRELERRGQRIYPEPYRPIRAKWALIENRP